jgi:hypothetical protein
MGLFQFNVMPFGLYNAPGTFQRMMDGILREDLYKDVTVYLDDVLTFGNTLDQTLNSWEKHLGKIVNAGLKCKPRKCKILPDKLEFLGHVLSADGITADTSKIDKIRQWPMPAARVEMQSFLGLCNYYHKYIAKYAEAAKPRYAATKDLHITATPELIADFNRMKGMMCAIPLVRLPNPDKPFILTTDASTIAVGAELSQSDENGEYPVLWFSHTLNSAQRNYSTYERELFAAVLACDAFHVFLLGRQFLLRTDTAHSWEFSIRSLQIPPELQNGS